MLVGFGGRRWEGRRADEEGWGNRGVHTRIPASVASLTAARSGS